MIVETDLIGMLLAPRPGQAHSPPAHGIPDPARLGRRMAALYASWQCSLPDLVTLADALLRRVAAEADDPLPRCCLRAARAVGEWGGLAYHSAVHHAEVATNAMVLAALAERQGHPLSPQEAAMLLAASFAHDLHYGASGQRRRFAAECASADALDGMAAEAGCSDLQRQQLRALVIATEPGLRLRPGGPLGDPLEPAVAHHLDIGPARDGVRRLAAILSDADLLSSAGLTPAWYRVQVARLEAEAGRPHRAEERLRFFGDIVGPDFVSPPGRVFSRNLAVIRGRVCGVV